MAADWNFNLSFSVRLGIDLSLCIAQIFIECLLYARIILGDGNMKVNNRKFYKYVYDLIL